MVKVTLMIKLLKGETTFAWLTSNSNFDRDYAIRRLNVQKKVSCELDAVSRKAGKATIRFYLQDHQLFLQGISLLCDLYFHKNF